MSTEFINGAGNARLDVVNPLGQIIWTKYLPETNSGGLTVHFQREELKHVVLTTGLKRKVLRKTLGYHYQFVFDYTQWIIKDTLLDLQDVISAEDDGGQIWLTPRIDYPRQRYKVYFTNEEIVVNICKGGIKAIGNKSVELIFDTIETIARLDWKDPDAIAYIVLVPNPFRMWL